MLLALRINLDGAYVPPPPPAVIDPNRLLKAALLPTQLDYRAAAPGQTNVFSMDFVNLVAPGDSIAYENVTISAWEGQDGNALQALIGSPTLSGTAETIVSQKIGGASPSGLQPGVIYEIQFSVVTVGGLTLSARARVACIGPVVSSAQGSPTYPSPGLAPTYLYSSAPIVAPGVYIVKTAGIAITLVTPMVNGWVSIVDGTGANLPNVQITGSINGSVQTMNLQSGQTIDLLWSPKDSTLLRIG